jgi:NADH dehydrogenase
VGGGFGGLYCAKQFCHLPAALKGNLRVTLVDRRNFHLFQPLLYQIATGALSPANIAAPLRSILSRCRPVRTLLGEVTGIEARASDGYSGSVVLDNGTRLPYDSLIVATGVTHQYFGHPEWEPTAPGLKTVEDATAIRHRILYAFEAAERQENWDKLSEWLTFVIVGGGPTGVELAGAIAEIARDSLRYDFRHIHPENSRIVLVEGLDRILPTYPPALSDRATASLKHLGVEVLAGTRVVEVTDRLVAAMQGEQRVEIPARTVLWAAGVQASPLALALQSATGCALDRAGRVIVEPDTSLPGHPEIMVIGDLANYSHQLFKGQDKAQPLPGVAQTAMQMGKYAAGIVKSEAQARRKAQTPPARKPFRYVHLGSMATIGRGSAVCDMGPLRLSGMLGWLTWLFIHLLYIVQFENKFLVLFQWAWNYLTRGRSARLITGELEH